MTGMKKRKLTTKGTKGTKKEQKILCLFSCFSCLSWFHSFSFFEVPLRVRCTILASHLGRWGGAFALGKQKLQTGPLRCAHDSLRRGFCLSAHLSIGSGCKLRGYQSIGTGRRQAQGIRQGRGYRLARAGLYETRWRQVWASWLEGSIYGCYVQMFRHCLRIWPNIIVIGYIVHRIGNCSHLLSFSQGQKYGKMIDSHKNFVFYTKTLIWKSTRRKINYLYWIFGHNWTMARPF